MKFRNTLLKMTGRDHALLEVRLSGDVAALAGILPASSCNIYGVHVIADSHVKIDGGVTTAHELKRRVNRWLEKRTANVGRE